MANAKPFPWRSLHRIVSALAVVLTLYLGVTGSLIELIDFRTIITAPSPFDPNLRAIREDFAGPGGYEVLGAEDYLAQSLPGKADLPALAKTSLKAARTALGEAPLSYFELRMAHGQPVAEVQSGERLLRIDATTGQSLGTPPPRRGDDHRGPPESQRNTVKHLHRMTTFGDWALWLNIFAATALVVLISSGWIIYYRVWAMRRRIKRPNPFWNGGGTWRSLHRSISAACALFLTIVTLSGSVLAYESLIFGRYMQNHRPSRHHAAPPALDDAQIPAMLRATLAAAPDGGIRVLRLRHFGPYAQGVVITNDATAQQLVFNTQTGARMSLTEPGYPDTGFPFGWQVHQWAKSVHRGDFFGLPGRIMSLLAGLAMVYLSVSGIVMYANMWAKRREAGLKGLFWK
jgi:uncharacterized iron-regulated membrane protein